MSDNCISLNPLTQSNTSAPTVLPSVNYTNQDFDSLKTRLALYVEQRFPNDFTDFFEADLGVMLLESWAFCADMLSFKMDQIANELFIDTVSEIENAFRIANQVGFQPTPPLAARALFSFTINSLLSTDMVIPAGFSVSTGSANGTINYELFPADPLNNPLYDQDIIIPAGSLTNTAIIGLEGQTLSDQFNSTGETNQAYVTLQSPVLFDSVRVDVDGTRWTQVDFFTDGQPRQEYRVSFDSSYNVTIQFGDGVGGAIPSQGSQIGITYRVGGGSRGNIVSGAIVVQSGFIVPGFGVTVPITITNYTRGEFGYDGDGIEEIRRKLPAYNKVQDRAVTGEDYKILAELFVTATNGQIGKATAVLRNSGCAGNVIDLYVLSLDGTDGLMISNDLMKVELGNYFEEKKMISDYLCIKDGVVKYVDTVIDLNVNKFYRKFSEEIRQKVIQRINLFFSLNNWEYGKPLRGVEISQSLADIKEISSINLTFTTSDIDQVGDTVSAAYYEIIRPDSTNIVLTFE
jgi:hypothetical protein